MSCIIYYSDFSAQQPLRHRTRPLPNKLQEHCHLATELKLLGPLGFRRPGLHALCSFWLGDKALLEPREAGGGRLPRGRRCLAPATKGRKTPGPLSPVSAPVLTAHLLPPLCVTQP